MKRFVCILMVVGITQSRAQNIIDIFRSEIPKMYLQEGTKGSVEAQLQQKAALNPELLYYYITYYSLLAEKQRDSARHVLIQERFAEHQPLSQRARWATHELESLEKMQCDGSLRSDAMDYFQPLADTSGIAEGVDSSGWAPDGNRVNFFVAAYLAGIPGQIYDSTVDYASMRHNAAERRMNALYDILSGKNRDARNEDITQITDYWYLLPSSEVSGHGLPSPADVSVRILSSTNHSPIAGGFSAAAGCDLVNDKPHVSGTVIGGTHVLSYEDRLSDLTWGASIAIRYTHIFSEYFRRFCSLTFELGVARGISQSIVHSKQSIGFLFPTYGENYSFDSQVSLHSVTTISIKCSTPILTVFRRMTIEPAIVVFLTRTGYSFTASGMYRRYQGSSFVEVTPIAVAESSGTDLSVTMMPALDVNIHLPGRFIIEGSAGTSYSSIRVGYGM